VDQPPRRGARTDVDGKVEHPGQGSLVAVVAHRDNVVVPAQPQLVIFDLDGTLTDSASGIVSSFRHALGEIGAPVPDGDLATRIVGPPMHHTLREMGLGEHADAAIAAYRADYTTRGWAMSRLFDGIEALLADLHSAGVRLAV